MEDESDALLSYDYLIGIPEVSLFLINDGERVKLQSGPLQLLYFDSMSAGCLCMDTFKYTLSKEIPVLRDGSNYHYILPHLNSFYGFIIHPSTDSDLIDAFESLLAHYSDFGYFQQKLNSSEAATKTPLGDETPNEHSECKEILADFEEESVEIKLADNSDGEGNDNKPAVKVLKKRQVVGSVKTEEETEEIKELSRSERLAKYIRKGGNYVKKVIVKGAEVLSLGIKRGGKYIEGHWIKKNKKSFELKESTKAKIKAAKKASKSAYQFTKAKVKFLLDIGTSISKQLGESFGKSEKGEKLRNSKLAQPVKQIGGAVVNAAANTYEGMVEALEILGKGSQEAAVGIVDKKYGPELMKAVDDGLDIVGNVGLIVKAPEHEFAKKVKKQTNKKGKRRFSLSDSDSDSDTDKKTSQK